MTTYISEWGFAKKILKGPLRENEPLSPGGRAAGMIEAEMLTRLAQFEQRAKAPTSTMLYDGLQSLQ